VGIETTALNLESKVAAHCANWPSNVGDSEYVTIVTGSRVFCVSVCPASIAMLTCSGIKGVPPDRQALGLSLRALALAPLPR
ncbi:jg22913, partial [Pararge aegeria aegeria]